MTHPMEIQRRLLLPNPNLCPDKKMTWKEESSVFPGVEFVTGRRIVVMGNLKSFYTMRLLLLFYIIILYCVGWTHDALNAHQNV